MKRRRRKWSLLWPARFVALWEGLLLKAYLDTITAPPVWTIGAGWTGKIRDPQTGELRPIQPGDRISKRYAMKLLAKGLRQASRDIAKWVDVPLTVRQRMALLSLYYNIGPGAFADSTVLRRLNEGDYRGAANAFLMWRFAGGVEVEGLLIRRRAERRMFLSKSN